MYKCNDCGGISPTSDTCENPCCPLMPCCVQPREKCVCSKTEFTVEQIKTYILSQDSMGDILYNLNVENIRKANTPTPDEWEDDA